jgi:RNA polymerase sigma factor (sigma-70 family)
MSEQDWLSEQFEANRTHMRAVALRMLGSPGEADDAVQESWLRVSRADTSDVENFGGWLTTVVSRVCLDVLRSRKSRREDALGDAGRSDSLGRTDDASDPEYQALLADAVGPALLLVLETLTPAERLAFVLHDMFDVSFDEIAAIVDRSPAAARQLASRARRRVRGATTPTPDRSRQREIVDAFLAAARNADFDALLTLLDPEVVHSADATAVKIGGSDALRGAAGVAEIFSGRAMGAQVALVGGTAGLAWAPGGRPKVVWEFTIVDDKVVGIEMLADRETLDELDLTLLDD